MKGSEGTVTGRKGEESEGKEVTGRGFECEETNDAVIDTYMMKTRRMRVQ